MKLGGITPQSLTGRAQFAEHGEIVTKLPKKSVWQGSRALNCPIGLHRLKLNRFVSIRLRHRLRVRQRMVFLTSEEFS
jgi:hypothetical protein